MQKQAPSVGRILVAVGFTLSCFALLLLLWVTFGGPIPFKPESYRFTVDFPEAITLSKEADVRIGGVSVGKVKQLGLAPESECQEDRNTCNATRATIEIEPQYAPISSDAKAILRSKTLLGETFVELTTGSQTAPQESSGDTTQAQSGTVDVGQLSGDDAPEPIPEGGHLAQSQVQNQTQIDEIFQGFDEETRTAFQSWMQNAGIAINGQGLSLNDAFGNLGPFASDASDVLGTLRSQEQSLRTLVHDTGDVFAALTEHDQALAGAIVGANRTFGALASQSRALADTFRIFPTFENEGRLTLDRLKTFAEDARPVFHDLRPVMDGLDPFLANFNPLIRWLDYQAPVVTDFLANPSSSTADFLPTQAGQDAPLHLSRQMTILTAESLSIYQKRLATNRGNGYLQPFAIGSFYPTTQAEIFPSHDCNNTFGSQQVLHSPPSSPPQEESGQFPFSSVVNPSDPRQVGPNFPGFPVNPPGPSAYAACTIAPNYPGQFGGGKIPEVLPDP